MSNLTQAHIMSNLTQAPVLVMEVPPAAGQPLPKKLRLTRGKSGSLAGKISIRGGVVHLGVPQAERLARKLLHWAKLQRSETSLYTS